LLHRDDRRPIILRPETSTCSPWNTIRWNLSLTPLRGLPPMKTSVRRKRYGMHSGANYSPASNRSSFHAGQ